MHGEELPQHVEAEAQPPVLDYAVQRRGPHAWVLLMVLGLVLSLLHFGMLCCLVVGLLFGDESLIASVLEVILGIIFVLVACLPLYLLQLFGTTIYLNRPTGTLLAVLNSCLYGFSLAFFVRWLWRRRMRRLYAGRE
jgi:hypothetical protein